MEALSRQTNALTLEYVVWRTDAVELNEVTQIDVVAARNLIKRVTFSYHNGGAGFEQCTLLGILHCSGRPASAVRIDRRIQGDRRRAANGEYDHC